LQASTRVSDQDKRQYARLVIDEDRYRCLTDLYFLTTEVLNYVDCSPEIHKPICEIVQAVNPAIIYQARDRCPLFGLDESYEMYKKLGIPHAKDGQLSERLDTNKIKSLVKYEGIDVGRIGEYIKFGEGNERLFLLHRGSFKTSIISISHTIQLILLWPEIRILIDSIRRKMVRNQF
jgi:hypothetical protein